MNTLIQSSRLVLSLGILLLYLLNFHICEYFYPDDVKAWWSLKLNIYAIIIALAFLLASLYARGICKFFLNLGVGFTVSSVIDRWYFDITQYTEVDVIMVIVTIMIAYIDYKKPLKTNG